MILSALIFSAGCGGEALDAVDPALINYEPTYTRDIVPILRQSCVGCHSSDGVQRGGVVVDSYDTVYARRVMNTCVVIPPDWVDAYADILRPVERSSGGPRPPCDDWELESMPTDTMGRLTRDAQWIFLRWLELGAPQ